MKLIRYLIYGLIGLYVGLTTAKADSFAIAAENDTLSFPKSDRNYTHGTDFLFMRDDPFWVFDNLGLEVEQTIYGPQLIKTDELQPKDHPYCGYLSFNLIGEQWFDLDWADLSLRHSLGFGGVGPNSFSEDSQKIIHKWLGCKEPLGWKYQIKDEFIVQYEGWANLNIAVLDEKWFMTFVVPRCGVDVGGFKDMVAAGVDLKFGLNPPKNVGHGMILSAPKEKKNNDWHLFLLVGVEGRAVFHDTSIDGGFFRDSPYTNESETWVGEFHWGVGARLKWFEIEYTQFIRSKEFKTQEVNPNYGRLVVKWNF